MRCVKDGSKGNAFTALCEKFRVHHQTALNLLLHLITTPLGILAAVSIINNNVEFMHAYGTGAVLSAALVLYSLSLLVCKIPFIIMILNTGSLAAIALAAHTVALTNVQASMLLAVSYFGQDLAHYITGESTFQSTYQSRSNFFTLLLEHTYFLLPLCIDAAISAKLGEQMLDWFTVRSSVRFTKLQSDDAQADLKVVKDWLDTQELPKG
jgi:uncharacterized membrane protein YGL010W